MDGHPSLLTLPGTESGSYPLVLVVGQEPNGTGGTVDTAGHYPFEAITAGTGEHVTFWDRAYGLVSRSVGLEPSALKRACLKRTASPIVFADVSPWPLPSGTVGGIKHAFRTSIPELDFERQGRRVFAHSIVRERVAVVVVAGAWNCGMNGGTTIFEKACERAGKPLVHVPSLSSRRHRREQYDTTLGEHCALVADCARTFLDLPIIAANTRTG